MVKPEKTPPYVLPKRRRKILLAFISLLYGFLPLLTYYFILKKALHSNHKSYWKILATINNDSHPHPLQY